MGNAFASSLYVESRYLKEPELHGWPKMKRNFARLMGYKGSPAKEVVQLSPERWAQYVNTPESREGINKELEQGSLFVVVPHGHRFNVERDGGIVIINVYGPNGWAGAECADDIPGIHIFTCIPPPPKPDPIRVYKDP